MKTDERKFLEALEEGIALFNEARFMEAYEVWEKQWAEDASEGTDLLQGLLQVAVGLAKLQGGNPKGTAKLLERGIAQLKPYQPQAYDIDIDALVQIAADYRTKALELIDSGQAGGNTVTRAVPESESKPEAQPQQPSKKRPWWSRVFRR